MKVIRDTGGEPDDCLTRYLEFEEFGDSSEEDVFFYGYGSCRNLAHRDTFKNYKRRVFLQQEQPCGFMGPQETNRFHYEISDYYTDIYSTCPYTSAWINAIRGEVIYKPTPFIFNKKHACTTGSKEFDVMYWGGIYSSDHLDILNAMSKFKYHFFTRGDGVSPSTSHFVSGTRVPRTKMWDTLSRSKVMLVSNLLYLKPNEIEGIKLNPKWEENEAFSHIDAGLAPQLKTRAIEAVFNKTLVLLRKDPWNVWAKWFTPDVEFLYYNGLEDLLEKLEDISKNWERYQSIVDSAYTKGVSLYTTERFFSKMLTSDYI